jgi:hypothetical protein
MDTTFDGLDGLDDILAALAEAQQHAEECAQ